MKSKKVEEDEIDLIDLAKVIWSKRLFIIKVTSIFFALGLIIAFTSKVEYQALCKLLPESQEGSVPDLGKIGGLAGLAGFNLSGYAGSGSVITPHLYPAIINSTPFIESLIHEPIYFEKIDSTISSFQYFQEMDRPSLLGYIAKYTIGLPGKLRSLTTDDGKIPPNSDSEFNRFSKGEWGLIKGYAGRLSISVDPDTGIISVEVELPDPVAATQITNLLVERLTNEVIDYKIEKAKINLGFVKERFLEAESEYEKKQEQLARFSDRNRNITTSMIQTEYQRLQNETDIAFEVYKGLAAQLEQAKIKVKEETPIFTILEPVNVPVEKSRPKRKLILFISGLLGLIISTFIVLVRRYLKINQSMHLIK